MPTLWHLHAAVDFDGLAGNVTSFVTGEQKRGADTIFGFADIP